MFKIIRFNHSNTLIFYSIFSSLGFHSKKNKRGKNMPAPSKKRCSSCGKEKTLSDFYHNATKADHHNSICKDCQKLSNSMNRAKKNLPNF